MGILIQQVQLNRKKSDILIEGNRIAAIGEKLTASADQVIDGREFIAVPAFYNTHTHAAMSLLCGYADNLELMEWLQKHIWPAEAKMGAEHIYWGTKLACLEMIKSGTVFFNDMYWQPSGTLRAACDMKVRAAVGLMTICGADGELLPQCREDNARLLAARENLPDRLIVNHAPHAIYTVGEKTLRRIAGEADELGLRIHIHVSETAKEVADCRSAHDGMTPVEYLDSLGIIRADAVLAHCVHLTDRDREIIAERGAVAAHMPVSNMKLCSGMFDFEAARRAGCRVAIGTDGASSNNNLSMLDEMKFAALTAKARTGKKAVASVLDD